jgi:uncharacterized protein (UPF0332 family)
MSTEEQSDIKTRFYNEAMRYMDNAEDTLKKARKEGKFYDDEKYVKTACGTAYNGVLKALDGYLLLKNTPAKKGRKSIEYYQSNISKWDKKLNVELKAAYDILHLSGYYDGITRVPVIRDGFDLAYTIISRIQPST